VVQVRYADIDGVRTRYLETGTGDPVVLIHGGQYGSYYSASHRDLNLPALGRSSRVIALDKLGQGHTDLPRSDAEYTMTRVIEHCTAFVRALGLEAVTLVGHSRGALPAARIALDHPVSVAKLVLVDTNTLAPEHPTTPAEFYTAIDASLPSEPDEESVAREPTLNSYSTDHITPDFIAELLDIARQDTTRQARIAMKRLRERFAANARRERDAALDAIRDGKLGVPTLVVWGANDRSAPLGVGYGLFHHIAVANPNTEFHVLNRAAHYVFRERAAEFNSIVANFIRS
jgi:pimeloyl-ACP methyl ester carboxylesterase